MMDDEQNKDTRDREPGYERELINRLAFASVNEQRRTRRWNIFFKVLLFVYLFTLLFLAMPASKFTNTAHIGEHTATVEINGMIADGTEANAESINKGLRKAFEDKNTKGVVLRINSPGGSPVQSDYVYAEIRRLREEHPDIPVYAVIVDVGASGAYYIASAADAIYVNPSSMVGSIGVLVNSFGFVNAMERLGIERRLYTAGENKGFLDPFSPTSPENVAHMRKMLEKIHGQFIGAVKAGRGERLKEFPEMFSGLVWTGEEAVDLGLADGIGDVDYVARELVGAEDLVDFTRKPDLLQRFADRIGVAGARALAEIAGIGAAPQLR